MLDDTLALELVERGAALAPLDRAVLLVAALGGAAGENAADLPIDRRDRLLIDARIAAFGPAAGFFARCPHCGEGNEGSFDLALLPAAIEEGETIAEVAGTATRLRAPTSRAVARAVLARDPSILSECCVDPAVEAAPEDVEAALGQAFPLLDIRFDLSCTACEKAFDIRFDIVAWLWREIEGLARRAIDAVDRLARAYGWSEAEVLGLSRTRRALYQAKVAG